jgi:XRE family aerobic/anaerobic benzoate catabolism transcriptional regulator
MSIEATLPESGADETQGGNDEPAFLHSLGRHVRELRERRGMSRKQAARESGVSERHLAHLEAGEGNISILLLRRIVRVLNVSLADLLSDHDDESADKRVIRRLLERVPASRLEVLMSRLMRDLGGPDGGRRWRVALIGLRGAGKSTLGARLAQELGAPFIEIDREIERDAGMPVAEIFSLYGQTGYRRFEKRALERVVSEHERAVLSVGGGIVSQPDTYAFLLAHCHTVWLKAAPEEHMARVIAQGDLRPMAGHEEAMDDLRRILKAREALYAKADTVVDTSGGDIEASFARLREAVFI